MGCLCGRRNFWHMSHISTHPQGPLALCFFLTLSLQTLAGAEQKRKRNIRTQGLPGSLNDLQCCSQAPISLVSTRRGTVRIQNTAPLPKTRNAPLSAPCQLPVSYVKVLLAVNHAAGCQRSQTTLLHYEKKQEGRRHNMASV